MARRKNVDPDAPDLRGISETLKARALGDAASLAAIKESLASPITPDAETIAKHRLAPSERGSPFERETLEWYRNELALAQERILHLERDRERLLEEKRERDPILQKEIEGPAKSGKGNQGKSKSVSRFEKEYAAWEKHARNALVANAFAGEPDLDVKGIADAIKKETKTRRADAGLRKWVKEREADLRKGAKDVIDRARDRQEVATRAKAKEGFRRTLNGH